MTVQVPVVPRPLRVGLVGAIAVVLLIASVVPVEETGVPAESPVGPISLFALLHVLGYGALAGALSYATVETARTNWLVLPVVFLVAVTYGAGIEVIQGLLPYRLFSYTDIALNAVGAGVAVLCWALLIRISDLYSVSALSEVRSLRG